MVAIVISLFFDVRYSFEGKDDLRKVNDMIDQAGSRATEWMNESYKHGQEEGKKEDKQRRREEHYAKKAEAKAEYWENKAKKWEERA